MKTIIKQTLVKLCKRLGETSPILLDFSGLQDGKNASALLDSMRNARFLEPKTVSSPKNQKVLIIAPHPDDEVIGMGGTLAQMIDNQCNVDVISLTFGADKPSVEEAQKCADFLNYKFIHFFDFTPKTITMDDETLKTFAHTIEKSKPDIIFVPFMLDDHDDHRRASDLLLSSVEKKYLKNIDHIQIWAYQVYTAIPLNAVVNITNTMEKKLEAIEMYQSRFSQRHWSHFAMGLSAFNVRFLNGNKKKDFAEVFLQTPLTSYLKMCKTYFRKTSGNCYSTESYNQ